MKEFKTVSAPAELLNVKEKEIDLAVSNYSKIIAKEAVDGWEFLSMGSVVTSIPPGCLFALLGGSPKRIQHNVLVFQRDKVN